MLAWLQRLFRPAPALPAPEVAPLWAVALQDALDEQAEAPPASWVADLLEAVQKLARAQAKQGARFDSLESKVEAGFAEARATAAKPAPSADVAPKPVDDLLDALDLLEVATVTALALPEGRPLAEGLHGVAVRLERQLVVEGLSRLVPVGQPVDGRVFRVVGEAQVAELPEGVVAHVVRAAVLRGEQRIREGEVLINRSPPHA